MSYTNRLTRELRKLVESCTLELTRYFAILTNLIYSVIETSFSVFNDPALFTEAAQTILASRSFLVHYKDAGKVISSLIKAGLK